MKAARLGLAMVLSTVALAVAVPATANAATIPECHKHPITGELLCPPPPR